MSKCPHFDKLLGMNEPISRRDFLDGTLRTATGALAAGACPFSLGAQESPAQAGIVDSASWTGYT